MWMNLSSGPPRTVHWYCGIQYQERQSCKVTTRLLGILLWRVWVQKGGMQLGVYLCCRVYSWVITPTPPPCHIGSRFFYFLAFSGVSHQKLRWILFAPLEYMCAWGLMSQKLPQLSDTGSLLPHLLTCLWLWCWQNRACCETFHFWIWWAAGLGKGKDFPSLKSDSELSRLK